MPWFSVAIRVYSIALVAAIPLVEFEIGTASVKELDFLNNWLIRGLLYIFLGLLTLEEVRDALQTMSPVPVFVAASGYVLIAVGSIYTLLGPCCKRIRDKHLKRYRTLLAHGEIESALLDDSFDAHRGRDEVEDEFS